MQELQTTIVLSFCQIMNIRRPILLFFLSISSSQVSLLMVQIKQYTRYQFIEKTIHLLQNLSINTISLNFSSSLSDSLSQTPSLNIVILLVHKSRVLFNSRRPIWIFGFYIKWFLGIVQFLYSNYLCSVVVSHIT